MRWEKCCASSYHYLYAQKRLFFSYIYTHALAGTLIIYAHATFFLSWERELATKLASREFLSFVVSWIYVPNICHHACPVCCHGIIHFHCIHTFFFCRATANIIIHIYMYTLYIVFRDANSVTYACALAQIWREAGGTCYSINFITIPESI